MRTTSFWGKNPRHYRAASDVYSLGMLFLSLLTGDINPLLDFKKKVQEFLRIKETAITVKENDDMQVDNMTEIEEELEELEEVKGNNFSFQRNDNYDKLIIENYDFPYDDFAEWPRTYDEYECTFVRLFIFMNTQVPHYSYL